MGFSGKCLVAVWPNQGSLEFIQFNKGDCNPVCGDTHDNGIFEGIGIAIEWIQVVYLDDLANREIAGIVEQQEHTAFADITSFDNARVSTET